MFPIQEGLATSSTAHFIELHIQRARPRRPSYQEPAASALPLTMNRQTEQGEEPSASALPLNDGTMVPAYINTIRQSECHQNEGINVLRKSMYWPVLVMAAICGLGSVMAFMQPPWERSRRGSDMSSQGARNGVPTWEVDDNFKSDVFTFARVRYSDGYGRGWGRRGGKWRTDYPDSDLNFSLRLQQLTSLKVNPDPVIVELTSPELFDYPFIYLIEPGDMVLSPEEVAGLRRYCLNGGFMMVDDFWGDDEYRNFYREIKRAFPDREPQEVPLEHPIFQCVYPLSEKPQVPSIHAFYSGYTYEGRYGSDTSQASYKAIYDDAGRIMVFICHNTDLGDGWEREGENHEYFAKYAVAKSYPLGINIVTYAMTH